ncbi:MAG: hypothetical protein GY946_12750 [bacterium]|nr:hypothetical protein [bacterium]
MTDHITSLLSTRWSVAQYNKNFPFASLAAGVEGVKEPGVGALRIRESPIFDVRRWLRGFPAM